jgi:regulator of RNase E activity RraA
VLELTAYGDLSPTAYGSVVERDRVMDIGIRPLWTPVPRVAGPAYTARCAPGDNLMLHAAIYRAEPGAVLVVEGADVDYALAGGNVCAVAKRRGIAAFVVDGVVRDLAEIRSMALPVFARGVIPIPGRKDTLGTIGAAVRCGGVYVEPGDLVVADEEGIVVLPRAGAEGLREAAARLEAKEAAQSLDEWEAAHRARVEAILREKGL